MAKGGAAGRYPVGSRFDDRARRGHVLDATADRERNGGDRGDAPDDLEHRGAVLDCGGDVEHGQFIRPRRTIRLRAGHRITGILDVDEMHAFNHSPVLHIEARHEAVFR